VTRRGSVEPRCLSFLDLPPGSLGWRQSNRGSVGSSSIGAESPHQLGADHEGQVASVTPVTRRSCLDVRKTFLLGSRRRIGAADQDRAEGPHTRAPRSLRRAAARSPRPGHPSSQAAPAPRDRPKRPHGIGCLVPSVRIGWRLNSSTDTSLKSDPPYSPAGPSRGRAAIRSGGSASAVRRMSRADGARGRRADRAQVVDLRRRGPYVFP
jgi:hypothetical protein